MTTLPPDTYLALGLPRNTDRGVDESPREVMAEKFIQIRQAYEIIGDQYAREAYNNAYILQELRNVLIKLKFARYARNNGFDARRTRRQRLDTLEGLGGFVNGKYVVTLCDTGADENFIAEDTAKELGLDIIYLLKHNRPSFVMGHGRLIFAIGSIKTTWKFENGGSSIYDITFHVLKDCIFDVMIGSKFLNKTETMTEHRYRLYHIPKPARALRKRAVNLRGTPSQRIRGSLKSEECDALPDSGVKPNLLSYEYVEKRNWLLDMFSPPESCQLLQFADGSTETVSGRLRLQWSFVKGWGIAPPGADDYVDFDVLRGCPFDVILGSDFLSDTDAFVTHQDSFQEVIQEDSSGLNTVMWIMEKKRRRTEQEFDMRDTIQDEIDRELQRRANTEWETNQRRGYERLRVDKLDRENDRRNQWESNHPGRGYDRNFSSTNSRPPSRTPIQTRTSNVNARVALGAKRTIERKDEGSIFLRLSSPKGPPPFPRPPPSSRPPSSLYPSRSIRSPAPTSSVPPPHSSKSTIASRLKIRERSFSLTGSDYTRDSRSALSTASTSRMSAEEAERGTPRQRKRDRFRF